MLLIYDVKCPSHSTVNAVGQSIQADISGCARPALWIGSYENHRLSGQDHAKLAVSRITHSKLVLISWATQPDSQHNRSAHAPLLETRIALGYTRRWRVTTSYEECTASLLRVMWVYYEFKWVQHELQRVVRDFKQSCRVTPSCAELHEELYASYRECLL